MPLAQSEAQHVEQQLRLVEEFLPLGRTTYKMVATTPTSEYTFLRVPVYLTTYTTEHLVKLAEVAQACADADIECKLHTNSYPAALHFSK